MVVGTLVADGSSARAADTAPATTATTSASPAPAAGSGTTAATDANGAAAPSAPTRPATGYGFGDDKPARSAKGKAGKGKGSTTSAAHPTITYVLKGAQVLRRNNQNALVTVHFNTPVARARLIPTGRDVRFVVDLRADTAPTFKVVAAKENSAILQIDFPKGDFLPNGADDTPEPVSPDAPKVFEKDDTQ